ncbi:MAG: Gx transporter family protein [Clostridia bacterium]|nr:Gx transporter family protein [Clostridia bacterium]
MKAKKITQLSLFCAVAMIMSYIEALIPLPLPFGIKVGLPNIIIVFILYRFGPKEAAIVSLVRVILVSLLFGNAMTLAYSLAGAFLSIALMTALKATKWFTTIGISVAGGIFHNTGQTIVACLLMNTLEISSILPLLTITGTIAGILVGICGHLLIAKFPKI